MLTFDGPQICDGNGTVEDGQQRYSLANMNTFDSQAAQSEGIRPRRYRRIPKPCEKSCGQEPYGDGVHGTLDNHRDSCCICRI